MPKHHVILMANPNPDALLEKAVAVAQKYGAQVTQFLYDRRTNLASVTIDRQAELDDAEAQGLISELPRYAMTNLVEFEIPPHAGESPPNPSE